MDLKLSGDDFDSFTIDTLSYNVAVALRRSVVSFVDDDQAVFVRQQVVDELRVSRQARNRAEQDVVSRVDLRGGAVVANPVSKASTRGAVATTTISREAFGLVWNMPLANGVLVGDEIKIAGARRGRCATPLRMSPVTRPRSLQRGTNFRGVRRRYLPWVDLL